MGIQVDERNLKQGLLALVVALVEVIQEALEAQALRRMEGGELLEEEVERLGTGLRDLDDALEQIKMDHELQGAVEDLRRGLDDVVERLINPARWVEEPGP